MSNELGFGALSLQSGFVIAVLIAAVLVADRLGGDEVLARRGIQVVIGLALTLAVFSGTTAFIRSPEPPDSTIFETTSDSDSEEAQEKLQEFAQKSAQRASESGSVHVGLGMVLAVVGGILLRRMRAIPSGFLLGGVLLLLLGAGAGGEDFSNFLTSFYGSFLGGGDAGQSRDIARFVVLLAGTIVLLGLTWWRWEVPEVESTPPPEPTATASV